MQRYVETERFRSRETDYKFKLGRLLNWQIGRLLAFEDAADIDAGLAISIDLAGAELISMPTATASRSAALVGNAWRRASAAI